MKRRKRLVTPTMPATYHATEPHVPATYRLRVMTLTPLLERLRALAMLQNLRLRLHQHTKKMEIQFMTELGEKYGLVRWEGREGGPTVMAAHDGPDGPTRLPTETVEGTTLGWVGFALILTLAITFNALFLYCMKRPCFQKRVQPPPLLPPPEPPVVETIVLQILDEPEERTPEEVPEARSPSAGSVGESGSVVFGSEGASPLSPSLLRAFPPPYEDDPPPPYPAFTKFDSPPGSPPCPPCPPRPPQYSGPASPPSTPSSPSYSAMSAAGTPWPPPHTTGAPRGTDV